VEALRLATPEEIEAIREGAEITPLTRVLVCGNQKAVIRPVLEVDPVFFEGSSGAKFAFIWGVEGILRTLGETAYYFNTAVTNEAFQKAMEKLGATRTSKEPEYRYRKVL
jgi:hypothetical protein